MGPHPGGRRRVSLGESSVCAPPPHGVRIAKSSDRLRTASTPAAGSAPGGYTTVLVRTMLGRTLAVSLSLALSQIAVPVPQAPQPARPSRHPLHPRTPPPPL